MQAMEGTPGNLVQTPCLPPQVAGTTPSAFQASPFGATDGQIFTPSSRKLLLSMAPDPIDSLPFDVPTGLTPQSTPQPGSKHASAVAMRSGGTGRLSGRRFRSGMHGSSTPAHGRRAAVPTSLQAHAKLAAEAQAPEASDQADKPAVSRRLHFDRSDDDSDVDAADKAAMNAADGDAGAAARAAAARTVARLAHGAAKHQMRPPSPPSAFQSPLKRQRSDADDDAGRQPLFVPSASEASQPAISHPGTPGRGAACQEEPPHGTATGARGTVTTDTVATGGSALTNRETGHCLEVGHSDTSTGKSSMSCIEPAGGPESRDKQQQALAESLAQQALARVQDAVASGQVSASSQLKSQLHTLIDSMFAASA